LRRKYKKKGKDHQQEYKEADRREYWADLGLWMAAIGLVSGS
jgi:hypothetical protein